MRKANPGTRVSLLLAIAMVLPPAALAAAPSQFEDVSVRVAYADLDIHTEAGAKALYSRLKKASKQACGLESYAVTRLLVELAHARACYRESLESSVQEADSDVLIEIHNG
jgi:UrcA family protein